MSLFVLFNNSALGPVSHRKREKTMSVFDQSETERQGRTSPRRCLCGPRGPDQGPDGPRHVACSSARPATRNSKCVRGPRRAVRNATSVGAETEPAARPAPTNRQRPKRRSRCAPPSAPPLAGPGRLASLHESARPPAGPAPPRPNTPCQPQQRTRTRSVAAAEICANAACPRGPGGPQRAPARSRRGGVPSRPPPRAPPPCPAAPRGTGGGQ